MASRTAGVLQDGIRSVAYADKSGMTDQELLRRFAVEGDQAAFAALVGRHTGLVLGVCQRVLANRQDAEDACQATFLVLAQKARSGRWQPSLANWLYTTARKVARNARVAAQRRARREGQAIGPKALPAVDRVTGRELLAALDEELDNLPPHYREPLVLCYLEGLTRDEAATRLGVPVGTLKIRLERGRKRLGAALTRRGCVAGAGLLALAATSPARASSPRLVQAILAAASGTSPAAVAVLAKGVAVNGAMNKLLTAGLLLVGAATLGIGIGSVVLTAAAVPDPAPPAPAAAQDSKKADAPAAPAEANLLGRVLAADGKPLAGAKLLLIGKGDRPADLGTSGEDGRFAVPLPKDRDATYLIARADGLGIDFVAVENIKPRAEVELRTVADVPIRGRVVDTEGKPVAGAWVRVDRLGVSSVNSLDWMLTEWKKLNVFSAPPHGERQIWGGAGALWTAATDKDGRFEFRGVGVERLAVLRLGGAGVTECEAYVATRQGLDPKEYNEAVVRNFRDGLGGGKPRWQLYRPDCGIVVEREKRIRGRVTDVDTGQPRAGVHVILSRSGSELLPVPLGAWTDKDGRYEIRGARKAGQYMVEIQSDPATAYMACQAWGEDAAGYEPITIDLRCKKGVIVTGRMLDKGTGKPVAGFVVLGVPQGNPSIKDYPTFTSSGWLGGEMTAADGTFRAVTIPGPVLLMGGPNTLEEQGRYKRPAADPKYPQFFKVFGDHTAYYLPGGAISPLQGCFCKVLEIKPGTTLVKEDIVLEPVAAPLKPGKSRDKDEMKEKNEMKQKPSAGGKGE
jgi:RNA polymerase sigma factor (sigma-70 family)